LVHIPNGVFLAIRRMECVNLQDIVLYMELEWMELETSMLSKMRQTKREKREEWFAFQDGG
jgi:hypothetical protein